MAAALLVLQPARTSCPCWRLTGANGSSASLLAGEHRAAQGAAEGAARVAAAPETRASPLQPRPAAPSCRASGSRRPTRCKRMTRQTAPLSGAAAHCPARASRCPSTSALQRWAAHCPARASRCPSTSALQRWAAHCPARASRRAGLELAADARRCRPLRRQQQQPTSTSRQKRLRGPHVRPSGAAVRRGSALPGGV